MASPPASLSMLGHCLIEPDREHDQSEQLLPTNNLCMPLDQLGRRPGGHQLVFELGIRVLPSLVVGLVVVGTGAEQTASSGRDFLVLSVRSQYYFIYQRSSLVS